MTIKPSKKVLFSVVCILPIMLGFIVPLSFYLGNKNEIVINLSVVLLAVAFIVIGFSILLFLLLSFIQPYSKTLGMLMGFILGLAIAIWIQSQLFVWDFGQFNGQIIDWGRWKSQMYLEGVVWFIIITFFTFWFYRVKKKIQTTLIMAVYLLGLLSVLTSYLTAPKNTESRISEPLCNDTFAFHPQKNVIIILLDAFQSDYFDYVLKKYHEDLSFFDGFIFYRNTISKFPTTKGSLPSILTGAVYQNEQKYLDYISDSRKKFDLMYAYNDMSYKTCFVGIKGTYPDVISMKRIVDMSNTNKINPLVEYFDYALFRALPTFFKPKIYDNGNWLFSSIDQKGYPPREHGTDIRFLELFEDRAYVKSEGKGTFKILHFYISHPPWNVNQNLKFDPKLFGETGYLQQIKGSVKLCSRMLKKLKEIGIYDSSEIIIMSDHGTWEFLVSDQKDLNTNAGAFIPQKIISSSHALLLYKPVNSKGKIQVNDIPLETTDLSCLLGLSNKNIDCNNFNIAKSGGNRQRIFYFYEWSKNNRFRDEHLPKIKEYIVNGHAYRHENYHPAYKLGKEVRFSKDGQGEADPYLLSGWSWQESTHRWTDGPSAGLMIQLEKAPTQDMILRLWGLGYSDQIKKEFQQVNVSINGYQIAKWTMYQEGQYEASIKSTIAPDGLLKIVFNMSNPRNPNSPENSKDNRKLGLLVKKLIIVNK
jgi:hypothetical protein